MKTIKQWLITVAVLLCSATASAYDFEVDGIYYNILSISDLTVVVTSGDNKYSGEVVIPSTVSYKSKTLTITSIGYHAFDDCDGLTSVTIGNSVTSIGNSAFDNCDGLTSITIPNSVTSIGNSAFYNCTSLKDLRIEDGETTLSLGYNVYNSYAIGEGLFYDCPLESLYLGRNIQYETGYDYGYSPFYGNKTLKSVTIGNSVTSIGSYAFRDCTSLKDLRIEDGETTLSLGYNYYSSNYTGEGLFYDCPLESLYLGRNIQYKTGYNYGYSPFYGKTKLKSVTIGNSVTSIGGSAFRDCSGLTSVTIGNSVTSIGSSAFEDCSGLTSVTIPNSVTSIGSFAFRDCSGLTSITIPNSVTSIGYEAFSNCGGLTSVTIGNSVATIGDYAFYYCSGLTSVTIGNSVASIGYGAFYGCSGLTSVTIPNSVTSIGSYAFYECSSLESIYLLGETPPTVGSYNFTNKQYLNTIVYVPKGTLATYQAADTWKDFWDIQEFDVTAIENIEDVTPAFEITSSGIQFTAAEGKAIAIYTANGALVEKIDCYVGEEITLDKGVYIVRVGNKTMKIRL